MGQLDSALLDLKDRFNENILDRSLKGEGFKEISFKSPCFTLHVNDMCHLVTVNPESLSQDYVSNVVDCGLEKDKLREFISLLRQTFNHTAWPISIEFRLSGLEKSGSSYRMSEISGISVANQMFRCTHLCPLLIKGRSSSSIEGGLDAFAEGLDLVNEILPPSNAPVRSWSIVNNIGGEHVRIVNMYARDEMEFLLKKRLFRFGSPAIRQIIEDGQYKLMNNEASQQLISAEVEDLELYPLGRRKRVMTIADHLNDHLKSRKAEMESPELDM